MFAPYAVLVYSEGMSAKTIQPALQLKKLTKYYGKYRGAENISLSVQPGSVFGFLGPNGAGKTTTISMIMGLLKATSGSVALFGKNNDEHAIENRARVGYLAGDMALDGSLTGWQELEYLSRLRGNFDKKYIEELAVRLQCDLTRKIKTLSRGNAQKVGLIAALMHRPDLLILDEPTSGLDPLIQAEFNEIIQEHKKAGKSAFISSHVLSEVQQICDEVGFIKEGNLIATKPLKFILRSAPKRVKISLKGRVTADFTKLPGATNIQRLENVVSFSFSGNIAQLVKYVSTLAIDDVAITEADLEAVFMSLYEQGAEHA